MYRRPLDAYFSVLDLGGKIPVSLRLEVAAFTVSSYLFDICLILDVAVTLSGDPSGGAAAAVPSGGLIISGLIKSSIVT